MDLSTWILFGVVAVLGINQAVMRVERFREDDRVYWSVQFLDLAVASAIILLGIPGFEAFPAVPVVVGLLFVFHVAQNYSARSELSREKRRRNAEDEDEEEDEVDDEEQEKDAN